MTTEDTATADRIAADAIAQHWGYTDADAAVADGEHGLASEVDAVLRALDAAGLLAPPDRDARQIIEVLVEVLATIAEMVGLPRDTDEPEVIVHRLRQQLAAPVPADDEAADGVALIAAERHRQVDVEDWTAEHDDQHRHCELLDAARCYVNQGRTWFPEFTHRYDTDPGAMLDQNWPWWAGEEPEGWKPSGDPITDLVKAGALICAEIDRLQRAALAALREEQHG